MVIESFENELWQKELWTQKEVAGYFRVSTNTVGNWTKRGLLTVWRAPGSTRVLYMRDEVRDFRDKNLKPRGEGTKPEKINGIKKGRPVVSTKPDKDWRI